MFVGRALESQSIRFLIAGALATAVNWISRIPLSLVFRFEVAVAIAYAIGMVVGFLAYRTWVFRGSRVRLRRQLLLFSLVNAAGLAVVMSVASAVLSVLSTAPFIPVRLAEAIAHGLALVVAAIVNFLGHRSLSFAQRLPVAPAAKSAQMRSSPSPRAESSKGLAVIATDRSKSTILGSDAAVATMIVMVTLSHRVLLWWLYGDDIADTIQRNQNWLTWQFLPLPAYKDHFLASLLYLQQTPPLPHIILGLLIKTVGWPYGVADSLIALQAFISAFSAALLYVLLHRIGLNRLMSLVIALWFSLSSDIYLLEVNEFGQLFYESGGMLLVTSLAVLLCDGGRGRRVERRTVGAGIVVGLAVLTRASLSFLAVPAVFVVAIRRGWRAALLFMVPVLILQGSWCLKNALVYRHLTLAASSWSGINAANGINVMNGGGTMDSRYSTPLAYFILDHRKQYPDWLIHAVEKFGYVDWFTTSLSEFSPPDVTKLDAKIQNRLGGTNPFTNSATIAELSRAYERVTLDYMIADPTRIWKKFKTGTEIFWQPISDYSSLYMGPLYVKGQKRDMLTGPYLHRDEVAFAKNDSRGGGVPERISLPALPLYALDTASILVFFALLPAMIALDVTMRAMRRTPMISGDLWTLIAIATYGIAVSTLVDLGENMRFRLCFEPIIISVTVGILMVLVKKVGAVSSAVASRSAETRDTPLGAVGR